MTNPSKSIALVGTIQRIDQSDEHILDMLAEMSRLADALGIETVGQVIQKRDHPEHTTYFGQGRLESIKEQIDNIDSDLPIYFIVDDELSPKQWRLLQEHLQPATVLDRAGVILDIFEQRAQTKEAKVQVHIARLNYLSPRLRGVKVQADRQRGAGINRGAGESHLELKRREVEQKLRDLKLELDKIQRQRDIQRQNRNDLRNVAFVGYTNAGKSTWMSALSNSEVMAKDQLFATLDTTVRALYPPANPPVVLADTVGFVRKLPHDLVASFRSTLEEALEASLLLHIVDASDSALAYHIQTTNAALELIEAHNIPTLLVMNKCDRLDEQTRQHLKQQHPRAVFVSAQNPEDVALLHQKIIEHFEGQRVPAHIFIPHWAGRARNVLFEQATIVQERYDEKGGHFDVELTIAAQTRLQHALDEDFMKHNPTS